MLQYETSQNFNTHSKGYSHPLYMFIEIWLWVSSPLCLSRTQARGELSSEHFLITKAEQKENMSAVNWIYWKVTNVTIHFQEQGI